MDIFLQKFGFPQVIGVIDGTHIPIQQPVANKHDYFCYKQFYSINCQAICDANGYFIDVEVKWPGSIHDARMFLNSGVNKLFTEKVVPLLSKELIPGDIPIHQMLIADPAFYHTL